MATDELESFRGLPFTRRQYAEIPAYIARYEARSEPWEALEFSCMLNAR